MDPKTPRLTQLSHCAGCAAKLRPAALAQVLGRLKTAPHPAALVGYATNDDAAVYRVAPGMAVVGTVDFFPPVVDDPYQFGRIAAANALSDIYAMGARPLYALNLVGFPNELPLAILSRILAGGLSAAQEAGIPILGGHSIQDPEPKYGMAVTGLVHPKRVLTNAGAKRGDVLLLTKPLGAGIATTALKRGLASKDLERRVVRWMGTLNRYAGEVFASGAFKVNALTDVTGFGLLGHLLEMMTAAGTRAVLELGALPFLRGVAELAAKGVVPGGTRNNWEHVKKRVALPAQLTQEARYLLADAQTNGGLLACVPARAADPALAALKKAGVFARRIGRVEGGRPGIEVTADPAWLSAWPALPGDETAPRRARAP